ncbi:hypothetical protein [Shewanella colwelliana]|uniref:hypothetical protein n=1 Tax=Shewanella colwelliana TaxID=23 RepID=UPI001C7D1BA6|nr:hypothetical protein [Shewanella colwelliana]
MPKLGFYQDSKNKNVTALYESKLSTKLNDGVNQADYQRLDTPNATQAWQQSPFLISRFHR